MAIWFLCYIPKFQYATCSGYECLFKGYHEKSSEENVFLLCDAFTSLFFRHYRALTGCTSTFISLLCFFFLCEYEVIIHNSKTMKTILFLAY